MPMVGFMSDLLKYIDALFKPIIIIIIYFCPVSWLRVKTI